MQTSSSWVAIPDKSDFTLHNLPFGIFSVANNQKRVGIAIGEQIIDLVVLNALGFFDSINFDQQVLQTGTLNRLISLGKPVTNQIRNQIQDWLADPQAPFRNYDFVLVDQNQATLHLPLDIGDYTDFYSSIEHATNVGKMFRDPENALLPNWKHLPVGYHGRASSIVVSGAPIHRPSGQIFPPGADAPVFQASTKLDFELEMAFVVGKGNRMGKPIPIDKAEDHIFGMVLFNDWSARDIQKWEYVPLGPFLGKSFASSISPWVVTMEALEPFRTMGPRQDPPPLPYLQTESASNFDINLEVQIDAGESAQVISQSNFKYMYWSMAQQLAHHTSNGCNIKVGDLMASGTISGPTPDSYGSMLELSWGGSKPVQLKSGQSRSYIEDQDTVTMRGWCGSGNARVGFGKVQTKVLPTLYE